MPIRCFDPSFSDEEINELTARLKEGDMGYGPPVKEFEDRFAEISGKKYNLAYSSASAAAFAIYNYFYDKHGSCDVYVPSFTFNSPVWAALKNRHRIRFIDIDNKLLFNVKDYRDRRVTQARKKIVMPTLYGGAGTIPFFDMLKGDEIVVVDSAHCIRPKVESDFIFFSFHPFKPIRMANGGILATNNEASVKYLDRYKNFGREPINDTYAIIQNGFKFYMNSLNASIGLGQLSSCFDDVEKRKANFKFLENNLSTKHGKLVSHDENSSYHLATLILDPPHTSFEFRQNLANLGVQGTYHYPLLHKMGPFAQNVYLPNSERVEKLLVNLPIHQNLSEGEMHTICEVINDKM